MTQVGAHMVRKLLQYGAQLWFAAPFGWPGVVAVCAVAAAALAFAVVFVHPMNGAQRVEAVRVLANWRR